MSKVLPINILGSLNLEFKKVTKGSGYAIISENFILGLIISLLSSYYIY